MVLASEAFRALLTVSLRARHAPGTAGIVIRGNPEFIDPAALPALAERVLDEAVRRLTTGEGGADVPLA